ncbi:hypothetical protein BGX38DRAFT_1182240 [Terfezia claveryi]|nr:hypothetical protein BGX38DRAFT_1182240 [Terfezia claveryi]
MRITNYKGRRADTLAHAGHPKPPSINRYDSATAPPPPKDQRIGNRSIQRDTQHPVQYIGILGSGGEIPRPAFPGPTGC